MFQQPDPPPAGDASAVLDWIDAVADRFESAWKAGPAPRLADFLGEASGDSRSALLRELVKIDLEYRQRAGAPRPVGEYLADFPELLGPDGSLPDDLIVYARRVCDRPAEGDEPAGGTLTHRGAGSGEATLGLRCPQCGNTVRGVAAGVREVTCPSCGGSFRVQPEAGAAPRPTDLPRTLGRFQLLELLGRGSFGAVYKGRDADLDRLVAVKVPRTGCFATAEEEEERFLREAKSAAQLSHPGIVPVHEIGRDGDLPYLVCDYVAGRTLADLLAEGRPGFRDAAELMAQAAEALDYAHRHGVIHRDVTPRNILLDAAGRPHLTDFGLARRDGASLVVTLDGQVLGTPAYMSPEQAAGEQARVDGRSDVYSLGVILYELLTGELPFRGSVRMLLHQVLHDEPRPPRRLNDRIPRDLETVCLKALAKEPARRYATAGDLAADLRRHLNGEPIRARPVGRAERLGRWCRRNPVVAGSVTAAALTLVTATIIGWGLALRADAEGRRTRRFLYVAQMKLAQDAWRDADIRHLLDLLEGQRPRGGAEDLRGFEWHYLRRLCHTDLRTLDMPGGGIVNGVAISPDGMCLAGASSDGTIQVWDATGQEIHTLKVLRSGCHVAFSPDGRWLAADYQVYDEPQKQSLAGEVQFWDAATGREVRTLKAHGAGGISSTAFSPDGQRLATAGVVLDGTGKPVTAEVKFWEMATGREVRALRGHSDSVAALAYSPDGRRLATASADRTVKLWDTTTGQELRTLAGHRDRVTGVDFSPDGRHVASASHEETIKVWDAVTGQVMHTLRGHRGGVSGVAFSPDGKCLASAGIDRTVRVWDTETGQELRSFRGHKGPVNGIAFSPDGRRLASSSRDGTVKVWDTTTDQESLALPGHGEEAWDAAFSPDGQFLAVATDDGKVKVWDTAGWHNVRSLEGHTGPLFGIAYSPDGRRLATCGRDGAVRVWDADSGQLRHTLQGHAKTVSSVAFSPDGRRLASSSRDGTVKVWDAGDGRLLRTLDGHAAVVQYVAFSPDGKRLASASDDKTAKVWDLDSGRELLTLAGHTHWVYSVAFSPDGRRLVTTSEDATVRVWDAATGREVWVLKGHDGWVWRAVFSPDGRRLASCGQDRTVRLWDVTTGQEILTLRGHTRQVRAVAFSPDGGRLASAGEDGTARVWDATPCDPAGGD